MKYTICGYQQTVLLEYNLDAVDAAILNYIDDFYNTGKMYHKIINNCVYFWVNFGTIINDMPILGIAVTRGISRRFDKFLECGLMRKDVVKGIDVYMSEGKKLSRRGTFTYFTFDPEKKERLVGSALTNKQQPEDPYKRRGAKKGTPFSGAPSEGLQVDGNEDGGVTPMRPSKDSSFINSPNSDISLIVAEAESNVDFIHAFNNFCIEDSNEYRKDASYWVFNNALKYNCSLDEVIYALNQCCSKGKNGSLSYLTGILRNKAVAKNTGIKPFGKDSGYILFECVKKRLERHMEIINSFHVEGNVIKYSLKNIEDSGPMQDVLTNFIIPDIARETGKIVKFELY